MPDFARFWDLHDQAVATLKRVVVPGLFSGPTDAEIAQFEEFIEEFNGCVERKSAEIDLEFLKRLTPLETAISEAGIAILHFKMLGGPSLAAQQVLMLAVEAGLAVSHLVSCRGDLLKNTPAHVWDQNDRVGFLMVAGLLKLYVGLDNAPVSAAPAPWSPALTGFHRLGVAMQKLECATAVMGVCDVVLSLQRGGEDLSAVAAFESKELCHLADDVAVSAAAVFKDSNLELAEGDARNLFDAYIRFLSAACSSMAAQGRRVGVRDTPKEGAPAAWATVLDYAARSAECGALREAISPCPDLIILAVDWIMFTMPTRPETHGASAAGAGRAAAALRRLLTHLDGQHVAGVRSALVHLEVLRTAVYCKENYYGAIPFQLRPFCAAAGGVAAAWAAFISWVCWKGAGPVNAERAGLGVVASFKSGEAALAAHVGQTRGELSVQDTAALLRLSGALSMTATTCMALLERGGGECDTTLGMAALKATRLRLRVDLALDRLAPALGGDGAMWEAAQAAAHAAAKQGAIILARWELLGRRILRPKEQLEMAVQCAAQSAALALSAISYGPIDHKKEEVGALCADVFHLIADAVDKLGVRGDPSTGDPVVKTLYTMVLRLGDRMPCVPIPVIISGMEAMVRLIPDSYKFRNLVRDMLGEARQVDPGDAAQAVLLARALGTLPCAHLGCIALPPPGSEDLELRPGKLCSGCRAVRYCGAADQKLGWKAHKAGCRLLQREREAASG